MENLTSGHGTTRLDIRQLLARDRARNGLENFAVQKMPGPPDIGILSRRIVPSSTTKWIIPTRVRPGKTVQLLFVGENHVCVKEVVPDSRADFRLRQRQTLSFPSDPIRAVALLGQARHNPPTREDTKLPSVFDRMRGIDSNEQESRDYPVQIMIVALGSGHLQMYKLELPKEGSQDYFERAPIRVALPTPEPLPSAPGACISVDPFSRAFAVAAAFDSVVIYQCVTDMLLSARMATDARDWDPIADEKIMRIPGCIVATDFLNAAKDTGEVVFVVVSAVGTRNMLSIFAWQPDNIRDMRCILKEKLVPSSTGSHINLLIPLAFSPDFLIIHGDSVDLWVDVLSGHPKSWNVTNKRSQWDAEPCFPAASRRRPQFTAWSRPLRVNTFKQEYILYVREDGNVRYYTRILGASFDKDTAPLGELGHAGDLGCHVDRAFAGFSVSNHLPDYMVAAGDMSGGEFHSIGINYAPILAQTGTKKLKSEDMQLVKQTSLPNWAPIMDVQIPSGGDTIRRGTLMVTAGRQPFGAVMELRIGFEAQVTGIVDLAEADEGLFGANRMWGLLNAQDGTMHCVCSYADRTVALRVSQDGVVEASGLLMADGEQTIYAGLIEARGDAEMDGEAKRVAVLVTSSSITIQHFDGSNLMTTSLDGSAIAAVSDGSSLLVATTSVEEGCLIHVHELHGTSWQLCKDPMIMENDVTAMHAFAGDSKKLALVATRRGGLHLLCVRDDGKPDSSPLLEELSSQAAEDIVAHSIQAVPTSDGLFTLLYGSRDGMLVSIKLSTEASAGEDGPSMNCDKPADKYLLLQEPQLHLIGHGPVQVVPDCSGKDRAFVLCDGEVLLIDVGSPKARFTSIVLVNEGNPSLQSPALIGLSVLSYLTTNADPSGPTKQSTLETRLVCHDGRNLLFATMLHDQQVLPRPLPLRKHAAPSDPDILIHDQSGSPTRVIFSKHLNATITAGIKWEHRPNIKIPEPGWQGKRVSRGFLQITPAHANDDIAPSDDAWNHKATIVDFAPGEKVHSVCEWLFEREGGSKHSRIVVGTAVNTGEKKMIDGRRTSVMKGKLWFFIPMRNKVDGTVQLELKAIKNFDKPIRALAVLDGATLLVAPHGELRAYTFDAGNNFTRLCDTTLPSAALRITTEGSSRITITTSQHSVHGYNLIRNHIRTLDAAESLPKPTSRFELVFTDNMARKGSTHTQLCLRNTLHPTPIQHEGLDTASQSQGSTAEHRINLLLGADKSGQIFGLEIPKTRKQQMATPTIFELHLPQSVTKFARGPLRASWYERDELLKGILADDIVGAATDGTVFHFTIVTNEARLLLKYLENLVKWNEGQDRLAMAKLQKRFQRERNQDSDVEMANGFDEGEVPWDEYNVVIDPEYVPGEAGQRHRRDQYGINGDVIKPLLQDDRRRGERLMRMLKREEIRTQAMDDFQARFVGNGRAERWNKFCKLVQGCVGDEVTPEWHEEHRMVDVCLDWLDEIMRPMF